MKYVDAAFATLGAVVAAAMYDAGDNLWVAGAVVYCVCQLIDYAKRPNA